MTDPEFSSGQAGRAKHDFAPSFRDPEGTLLSCRGRLPWVVKPSDADEMFEFLRSDAARRFLAAEGGASVVASDQDRVAVGETWRMARSRRLDILPLVVVEFIGPQDPQFRRLLRGRDELHRDASQESLEAACRRRFETTRAARLEGPGRWLYLLRKRKKLGAPGPRSRHV